MIDFKVDIKDWHRPATLKETGKLMEKLSPPYHQPRVSQMNSFQTSRNRLFWYYLSILEHRKTHSSNLLLINYHGVATSKWKKDGAKKEKIINSSHLWIAMQNPNLHVGT